MTLPKSPLTKQLLHYEYITCGKSDKAIARQYGVDRTTIVHMRQNWGIPTRQYSGELGEEMVAERLRLMGLSVVNMNEFDKTHPYDLIINDLVKVEVKSSLVYQDRWTFTLTNKAKSGITDKLGHHTRLPNGRFRKNIANACDLVILCGLTEDKQAEIFIIPPHEIPATMQTISLPTSGQGKWYEWHNRFDIIHDLLLTKISRIFKEA